MARRPSRHARGSKHLRPARPLSAGHGTSAHKNDGRWIVRSIPGAAAEKSYRCPGCNQLVAPGTPHVVVWPAEPSGFAATGVEERRHWHNACWERRR